MDEDVSLPALPATRTQPVLVAICGAYRRSTDGVDVLHRGMNNMGAIFPGALTRLNMGWSESTHADYQFYTDGVTPSVTRRLEVLDRARETVACALDLRARTALEWLLLAYNTEGENLHDAIHS